MIVSGFRIMAPARLDQVRLLVLSAMAVCTEVLADADALQTLELALAETLNNVAEHGQSVGGGEATVEVELAIAEAKVTFTVYDDCRPRPALPSTPSLPADMAEGGYGLFLIYELMDEVEFGREGDRNVARLTKRLAPTP
jgi:anti-sigma regulatory factor (Ser/Thr protein kinase)